MGNDYPVMLRLAGRSCLVVGGGTVAERKILSLLEAQADVTVVAAEWTALIESFVEQGRIRGEKRLFLETDMTKRFLVYAATNDAEVNEWICGIAENSGILANRADSREHSSFTDPAVLRRGKLVISVSTGGASPSMAKEIKKELEGFYGEEFIAAAQFLGEVRDLMQKHVSLPEERHRLLREAWNRIGMEGIRSGRPEEWMEAVRQLLRIEEEQ